MLNKDKRQYISWGLTALAVITASLLVSFLINRFSSVRAFFSFILKILMPIIYGAVMTFLTAPLYNRMAAALDKAFNHGKVRKEPGSLARGLATAACVFMIIAVITACISLLIPSIVSSVTDIMNRLPQFTGSVEDFLNQLFRGQHKDIQMILLQLYERGTDYVVNWYQHDFRPNMNTYLSSVTVGVVKVFSFLKNLIIGLIVMVYLLNIKNSLSADMKRFLYGFFPVRKANGIINESRYVKNVFSHFIVGKLIDSLIIGIICYICLVIMKMPYATVISVFVGITNIIPYFGPFIGAIPSAFILLLVSPVDMVKFLVFVLILQQFDGNILGPKIMSQTTGVSSFWVLFSILFFGGLWGIVGMIIGIPTFAVISRRINRMIDEKLEKKNLPTETAAYMELESVGFGDHHFVYKPSAPEIEDYSNPVHFTPGSAGTAAPEAAPSNAAPADAAHPAAAAGTVPSAPAPAGTVPAAASPVTSAPSAPVPARTVPAAAPAAETAAGSVSGHTGPDGKGTPQPGVQKHSLQAVDKKMSLSLEKKLNHTAAKKEAEAAMKEAEAEKPELHSETK